MLGACALFSVAGAAAPSPTVFGIEIGGAFRVPQCHANAGTTYSDRLCFNGVAVTRTPAGITQYEVLLPQADTPSYVRGALTASVAGGIVQSVRVHTWGIEAQGNALAALKKQYGTPTRAREERRNRLRSRFPVQIAEWDFPEFAVRFTGSVGSIDWGEIEISAHAQRGGGRPATAPR